MESNSDEDTCNTTDMTNIENEQQEEEKELVRTVFSRISHAKNKISGFAQSERTVNWTNQRLKFGHKKSRVFLWPNLRR